MARVTTILLSLSAVEPGFDKDSETSVKLDGVNALLVSLQHAPLRCLTSHMAGDKLPHVHTFGGAYSWLPDDDFLDTVKRIEWDYPHDVVLTMHLDMEPVVVWQPTQNTKSPSNLSAAGGELMNDNRR